MALISTKLHGVLDYAGGVASLAAPKLLRDRRAATLMAATGAGTLATSSLTDYELGLVRKVPMRVQDGWEAVEAGLIENATHGDGGGQPERDAFAPELESDRAGAEYGEADRIPSTEVVDDQHGGSGA